jgi:hypothetical protein
MTPGRRGINPEMLIVEQPLTIRRHSFGKTDLADGHLYGLRSIDPIAPDGVLLRSSASPRRAFNWSRDYTHISHSVCFCALYQ